MSKFEVHSKSALVSNMAAEASEMETFPVLIGTEIAHFHDVGGGYNERLSADVVNLIHRVQGVGSPYRVSPDSLAHSVELHLSDYYNLDVGGIRAIDDYPERDYMLSLQVDSFQKGEFSFNEAMTKPIDKRETRYES